MINTIEGFA